MENGVKSTGISGNRSLREEIVGVLRDPSSLLLGLAGCEFLHAAAHLQVLVGVGTLLTADELSARGWYFVLDAACVVFSAYVLLAWFPHAPSDVRATILILAASHFALHLYFILQWYDNDIYMVSAIREWSAESSMIKRIQQRGWQVFLANWLGTSFDIVVHVYMAALELIAFCTICVPV
ncbi:hypothetical protein EON65_14060 [archaeon]|nr:MAG: hypothetical protein EON65_14060 [archaeon]